MRPRLSLIPNERCVCRTSRAMRFGWAHPVAAAPGAQQPEPFASVMLWVLLLPTAAYCSRWKRELSPLLACSCCSWQPSLSFFPEQQPIPSLPFLPGSPLLLFIEGTNCIDKVRATLNPHP